MQRSQVMELCSWLSDVYAPRLTGSPTVQKAADWAVEKMTEWGLVNVKIEPWVNNNGFERGWTNDKFYMAVDRARALPDSRARRPAGRPARRPGVGRGRAGDGDQRRGTGGLQGQAQGQVGDAAAVPDVPAYWEPRAKRYTPNSWRPWN